MHTSTKYFITDLVEEVGSLGAVASQIVGMTSDPECDMGQLSQVILADTVMAARFLALANSAALARGHETRDLKDCLVRLGLTRVRNVALLMGMHDLSPREAGPAAVDLTEFWIHDLATAACAKQLARQRKNVEPEDAWLVGILHGIGVIALSQKLPADFQNSLLRARALKIPLVEAEMTLLEFHHGELGGRILGQWNLPRVFAEAIEFHVEDFTSGEVTEEGRALVELLRDSVRLCRAAGFGESGDGDSCPDLNEISSDLQMPMESIDRLLETITREVAEISHLLGMDTGIQATPREAAPQQRMAARLALEGLEDTLAREVLEEQLEMAREIQRKLLPDSTPDLPGLEIAAANRACYHISGDYYDFIDIQGGKQGIVIADVSGKGMPASLLASNLQASLRALGQAFADPGELLASVNRALYASTDPEHFATLFLAVMEPDGSGFRYASAGHNPPLLLRRDGSVEWLQPAGTPLGMFGDMHYPVTTVSLEPGDRVVAYTDGVTEATDALDREFEESGLEQAVRRRATAACKDLLEGIIADVEEHVQNGAPPTAEKTTARLGDDVTLVILSRTA